MSTGTTAIKITLPLPPRTLSPNGRCHWATKARAVKKYRSDAKVAALAAMNEAGVNPPNWNAAKASVTFYKRTAHKGDSDNLTASLKAGFDGIADAGVIANDAGLMPMPPTVSKDAANPRVEIVIEPLSLAE